MQIHSLPFHSVSYQVQSVYSPVSRPVKAAPAWQAEQVHLSGLASSPWTPAMKIALMSAPVAVGAGIGLARGTGAMGGVIGGAIGAAVSVFGLWWVMTVGNPFDRNPGSELPPPQVPKP